MLERSIVNRIVRWLSEQPDTWFTKIIGGPYGKRGVPDLIGCYKGRFFAVEVKRPECRTMVSPSQEHELRKIHRAGGVSTVATSLPEVQELLRRMDEQEGQKKA